MKFGSIVSSSPSCKLGEVIYPVQSYASAVSGCLDSCASSNALDDFSVVENRFGSRGFPDIYGPWHSVDWFGRQALFKQLEKRYCALLKERENPPPRKPSSIVSGTKIASTSASKDRTQSRASSSKS